MKKLPRAANRLSPLPVFNEDENQFEQYLKIVHDANGSGLKNLDEIADYCLTSEIKMASGKNYQKSNYRAVALRLNSLTDDNFSTWFESRH